MTENLLRRRDPSDEVVSELKVAQKYSLKNISSDALPFNLTAELGAVQHEIGRASCRDRVSAVV